MKLQKQIDQMTTQRASQWVEVLKNGTAADRAAFAEWLSESRKHVAEYLTMAVLDHELRDAQAQGPARYRVAIEEPWTARRRVHQRRCAARAREAAPCAMAMDFGIGGGDPRGCTGGCVLPRHVLANI